MGSQLDDVTVLFVCCQVICISVENITHGLCLEQPVLYTVSEKDCTLFFIFIFFLGAQCVESGVSCTDCY